MKRFAVIMAGGSGERFWPLSTNSRPKQLLRLTSPHETMLEQAVNRIKPLIGEVVLAIGSVIEEPVRAAALDARVWVEPAKRNTLGCLAWTAANLIATGNQDVTVAVLTADHHIGEPEAFRATVDRALRLAEQQDGIVTIGIPPTRAETGFGYIEVGEPLDEGYRTTSFREKPSSDTAKGFLKAGNFLWNSGMFFFRLDVFLEELRRAQPDTYRLVREIAEALPTDDERARELFEFIPSISVDFAVMEKARNVFVVRADFPWDDMGSWDALERSFEHDALGNVLQGRSVVIDSHGCVVYSDNPSLTIGLLGVQDLVVVASADGLLVCSKEQAQRVREVAVEAKKTLEPTQ